LSFSSGTTRHPDRAATSRESIFSLPSWRESGCPKKSVRFGHFLGPRLGPETLLRAWGCVQGHQDCRDYGYPQIPSLAVPAVCRVRRLRFLGRNAEHCAVDPKKVSVLVISSVLALAQKLYCAPGAAFGVTRSAESRDCDVTRILSGLIGDASDFWAEMPSIVLLTDRPNIHCDSLLGP
jgi:hypothetical protein